MAGMIPNKKSLHEIELEIEKLRDRHNRSVDSWLKARFEPSMASKDGCAIEQPISIQLLESE